METELTQQEPPSSEQVREFFRRLQGIDWRNVSGNGLGTLLGLPAQDFANRFEIIVSNGGNFRVPCPPLTVDRKRLFHPSEFVRQPGWGIWRGPREGDGLTGEERQDARSLALTQIDFAKVKFVSHPSSKTADDKVRLLAEIGCVRLDAQIARALLIQEGQRTLEWLHVMHPSIRQIEFLGTELRGPDGGRYHVILCCGTDGAWSCDIRWFESPGNKNRYCPTMSNDLAA
ncbi:MAG: hypothetical protein WAN50_04290 [Minisyncoccia bacterium]